MVSKSRLGAHIYPIFALITAIHTPEQDRTTEKSIELSINREKKREICKIDDSIVQYVMDKENQRC